MEIVDLINKNSTVDEGVEVLLGTQLSRGFGKQHKSDISAQN